MIIVREHYYSESMQFPQAGLIKNCIFNAILPQMGPLTKCLSYSSRTQSAVAA